MPTPGHTRLHCSLLVEFMSKQVVIAGDAIVSQSYYDQGKAWPYNAGNLGDAACLEAMNQIIALADYIIPGHGHPFQNYRKNSE
jgi:glyoxylase-like metal-dependent hydrolase (beta-lactamase superfamily II)